jgi:FkbM family methyltransferase
VNSAAFRRAARRLRSELRILFNRGRGISTTCGGQTFYLTPEAADAVVPNYEAEKFCAVIDAVSEGDTVFDVGGHHGLYTLALAQKVGPGGTVVCFEPCPFNLGLLRRNVSLNPCRDWIVIEPLAVGATDGRYPFHFSETDLTSASLNTVPGAGRTIEVGVTTLDTYWARTGRTPRVVKLDVEGHELSALRGMLGLMQTHDTEIHIEVHTGPEFGCGATPAEIRGIVAPLGYETVRWDGGELSEHEWSASGHVIVRRPRTPPNA